MAGMLVQLMLYALDGIFGVMTVLINDDDDLIVGAVVLIQQQWQVGFQQLRLVVGREDDGNRYVVLCFLLRV